MAIEQPIMSGAVKTSGFMINPLGRVNLFITLFFFLILSVVGVMESFEQRSLYPAFERSILPIVGADVTISHYVNQIESSSRPVFEGIFYKSFPVWLWFWAKNLFLIVSSLWFIYFFIWMLYWLFSLTNNSMVLRNVILAFISFFLITMFVGMIMYNVNLSGKCLVQDRSKVFNGVMLNTYPLHGTVKLFSHIFNRQLFNKVVDFTHSDLGYAVANIPDPVILVNDTSII